MSTGQPGARRPPTFRSVRLGVSQGLATVVIDRGERANAIDEDLIMELVSAFAWVSDRSQASAVLLTGSGGNFCAGYDLDWASSVLTPAEDAAGNSQSALHVVNQMLVEMRRIPVPIVAAIAGHAAGPGLSLALACDYRVASRDALLSFSFEAAGTPPTAGITFFLPRIVSPARAIELLLESPELSPYEALSEGIVQAVVEPEELVLQGERKARLLGARQSEYRSPELPLDRFRFGSMRNLV